MYALIRPLLFHLEAERAHQLSVGSARFVQTVRPGLVRPLFHYEHPMLEQTLWGRRFKNPVGLAAGFDKNAQLVRFWPSIGFGFAEIGSVTARASAGNPRPRAFRLLDDEALINRMGLNNEGAEAIALRLKRRPPPDGFPIGINIAKTHDPEIAGRTALADYRKSFWSLAPLGAYIALNISCPNTKEGKTFEDPEVLDQLLTDVFADRRDMESTVPILLKLSPALTNRVVYDSAIEEIIRVAMRHDIQGFIASNTASDRDALQTPSDALASIGQGGLSGPPLTERAKGLVRYLYRRTEGRVPIIGVGGIRSAETAYAHIRAGASLVQLYTALVYEGPGVVKRIKHGLVRLLKRDGFASIAEAVGADA